MNVLRRLLGMGEPKTPVHVQQAIDTAAAADKAFNDVHAAVDDYRDARGAGNKARDVVIRDYLAAERARTKR